MVKARYAASFELIFHLPAATLQLLLLLLMYATRAEITAAREACLGQDNAYRSSDQA